MNSALSLQSIEPKSKHADFIYEVSEYVHLLEMHVFDSEVLDISLRGKNIGGSIRYMHRVET